MPNTRLVVVSGAIASGKTTVTRELARRARAEGHKAAAINMDDIVEIVMGDDWRAVTRTHLENSRRLACALIDQLSLCDVSTIYLAGAFFNPADRDDLLSGLPESIDVSVVTLQVSLDEALRRCQADPTRTVSKDEALVRRIYQSIDWSVLPTDEVIISTEGATVEQTAARVAHKFGLP